MYTGVICTNLRVKKIPYELNRFSRGFLGDISPSEAFTKEVRFAVFFYIQESKTLHI